MSEPATPEPRKEGGLKQPGKPPVSPPAEPETAEGEETRDPDQRGGMIGEG